MFAFQHLHMISSKRWQLTYQINLSLAVWELSVNATYQDKKFKLFYATSAVLQKEFRRNLIPPTSVYGWDLFKFFSGSSKQKYCRTWCNTVQTSAGLKIPLKIEDQSYTILANDVFTWGVGIVRRAFVGNFSTFVRR